jgi:PRTRC genetic system protein B
MTNITNTFGTLYHPQKAFVIYERQDGNKQVYIESYDLDPQGCPINAHPLSLLEANRLSKALQTSEKKNSGFLTAKGLLPKNLLYVRTDKNPFAVWHTPQKRVKLFFKEGLGIKSGFANVPALVWKATKSSIAVFAINETEVSADTPLFNAPFFNIYEDGRVCMGNVRLDIKKDCALEDFMAQWEHAFFNSYFSHLIQDFSPVKGNIVQLWKSLSGTNKPFPEEKLIPHKKTVKHLIQ